MIRKITALVTLVKTWVEIESKYATKRKRREIFQNLGEINGKEKLKQKDSVNNAAGVLRVK